LNFLQNRKSKAESRLKKLQQKLKQSPNLAKQKACVYLTGSFGRGEASDFSDLDLFIVGLGTKTEPALTRLDEILIEGELITASRDLQFPSFSGDGEYLKHYTVHELIDTLGKPFDDATNTFTVRLLLLLESSPLLEKDVYQQVTSEVIEAYWRDYKDHRKNFIPAFLVNDILRLWRTFCVNYEARTRKGTRVEKAKRKLKNYKLKHSRLLTCYSAIVYLMGVVAERGTVSQEDARSMVALTPIDRLVWIKNLQKFRSVSDMIEGIISTYTDFLRESDAQEKELIERFSDKRSSQKYSLEANKFGGQVCDLLCTMGKENKVYRFLVV